MDDEGYFYIIDRIKDMIIVGGCKAYPREVEEVLYEYSKILEAAVIGIPHPVKGEAVKAFIVLKENQTASEEEIIEYCRPLLAKYKVPDEVEFRKELPKSKVGKILRKELRKESSS
jgi:long-chain acyl-CoA synthetase